MTRYFQEPFHHSVQFYESEAYLGSKVGAYIAEGLQEGDAVIVIARREHLKNLPSLAKDAYEQAIDKRQLILLDAHETLSRFMNDDGMPRPELFRSAIGSLLDQTARKFPKIRAYGEMVDILWETGNLRGTLELEHQWNELADTRRFSLMCGYSMKNFVREINGVAFEAICDSHTDIYRAEN